MPSTKRVPLRELKSPQALAIKTPLSPQLASSLKKKAKADVELAAQIYQQLAAILQTESSRSQMSYLHQVLVVCLTEMRDFAACNRAVSVCLAKDLGLESFAVLALQHSISLGTKTATTALKTPSPAQFQQMLCVGKKATMNHPSAVCVFLINVIRAAQMLQMVACLDLASLLSAPDGLCFWLDRLRSTDAAQGGTMTDHAFRLLYNIMNQCADLPSMFSQPHQLDFLALAKVVLGIYASTPSFSYATLDKVVYHFSKRSKAGPEGTPSCTTDVDLISAYYNGIILEPYLGGKIRESSLLWLENAFQAAKSAESSLGLLDYVAKGCPEPPILWITRASTTFCFDGITSPIDRPWDCGQLEPPIVPRLDLDDTCALLFCLLSSRLGKQVQLWIEPAFQNTITEKTFFLNKDNTARLCKSLEILYTWNESLRDAKNAKLSQISSSNARSLAIARSQCLFIVERGVAEILDVMRPHSTLLAADRLGSISFNIGNFYMKKGRWEEAMLCFEQSLLLFRLEYDKHSIQRLIKPAQGKIHCLLNLKRHTDCALEIVGVLKLLDIAGWSKDYQVAFESLVSLYVSTQARLDPYVPILTHLDGFDHAVAAFELNCLVALSATDNAQSSLLNYCIAATVDPLEKAKYFMKLAELERESGIDSCTEAIEQLKISSSSHEKLLLAKAHCELGISKGSQKLDPESDIAIGLGIWTELLKDVPLFRKGASPVVLRDFSDAEEHFGYLKFVAQYLHQWGYFRSELQTLQLCTKLLSLRRDSGRAEDALAVYLNVAHVYLSLGYSGKAGLSLTVAKTFASRDQPSLMKFYLAYADYLCSIGNTEKSWEIKSKVCQGVEGDVFVNLIESKILTNQAKLAEAAQLAKEAYRKALKWFKNETRSAAGRSSEPLDILLETVLVLVRILMLQGLSPQIDYYLKQGLELAEKFHHSLYCGVFSLWYASFCRGKHSLEESMQTLARAEQSLAAIDFKKFLANTRLVRGEVLSLKNADLADAEMEFDLAEQIVDNGMNLEYILQLDSPAFLENTPSPDMLTRCNGLEGLKADILCKIGALYVHQGAVSKAESKLAIAAGLSMTNLEKTVYFKTLAALRFHQFFKTHSTFDRYGVFEEAALALSSHDMLEIPAKLKKKTAHQAKIIDQLMHLFEDAYFYVCRYGEPHESQSMAFSYTLLQFYRRFVLQEPSDFDLTHAYLEFPKQIFWHRNGSNDVLECTKEAFKPSLLPEVHFSLPPELIVCSVNIDVAREILYVTRLHGAKQYLFKLPLRRLATREGEVNGPGLSFASAMNEYEEIMKSNKETTTNAKFCTSPKEKRDWRNARQDLDLALKTLLSSMEAQWIAGLKGLFSPYDLCESQRDKLEVFQEKLRKLLFGHLNRNFNSKKAQISISLWLCEIIVGVGDNPSFEELEDVLYYLLDSLQLRGISIDYDELHIEDMRDDLKDLVNLFYRDLYGAGKAVPANHIVLVLDKEAQRLPWESFPVLRDKAVSRVCSFRMLKECLERNSKVDATGLFYVLNPSGDLKRTEEKMAKALAPYGGIAGREPSKTEYQNGIEGASLFLYFGHGGGECYINVQNIAQLTSVPPLLLFGCSSGYLKPCGDFDIQGIALEYLKAGAPCVLGNLWDVTDVDIDKFAVELLQEWGLSGEPGCSLVQAMAHSRSVCNLKYIVGAAPVVYGLPIYLK
ncbi:hypothetical protein HDV03_001996 [Kappamyces sp. JEL0829]|nr:hypothetical protein HDV03_001996 [Kappamyces sp. JEL0829]